MSTHLLPPGAPTTHTLPEPTGFRAGRLWFGLPVAAIVAVTGLTALTIGLIFLTLGTGPLPATPGEVLAAVFGTADPGIDFAVMDIGLPRALTGAAVGAALGVAGSLLQTLTRNPLGSPDVIGFDSGTTTGALIGLLILGLPTAESAGLAVVGGLVAAAAVYLLSTGGRDVSYRIVLIGIGIGAMVDGINAYLLTRSGAIDSLTATRWLIGSLNRSTWNSVVGATVAVLLLLPFALVIARHLRLMVLGSELAASLGAPVRLVTAATLLLTVAFSAVAVLAAGPISFVALAAPQLAARVCRGTREPRIACSAAMGAALLVGSDLLAQRAFGADLPVGVVTGAVGGIYLTWLLARQWRGGAR